jgi:hypothetical protein
MQVIKIEKLTPTKEKERSFSSIFQMLVYVMCVCVFVTKRKKTGVCLR